MSVIAVTQLRSCSAGSSHLFLEHYRQLSQETVPTLPSVLKAKGSASLRHAPLSPAARLTHVPILQRLMHPWYGDNVL
jgi:hypothetical protein